ncbi:hypothetical protein LptCag_0733 [Leptospirillum ferriphilum]|uniref:Uncharacterized protein n=1 Tax=Leptospirillum ferriphilum TaxID=178606 RepID=A0A094WEP7_9BACT|nr:hypothetical protein LptCag_0733 [Leptospirillum ferriphilum]
MKIIWLREITVPFPTPDTPVPARSDACRLDSLIAEILYSPGKTS